MSPEGADGCERAQSDELKGALEHLQVAGGAQQHDDLARLGATAADELADALREQARLGLAPGLGRRQSSGDPFGQRLALLPSVDVGEQQLDRRALLVLACIRATRDQRRHAREALGEDGVDDVEQPGTAAEVVSQRQAAAALLQLIAPFAKEAHVGVPEAVDRLQLVADREQVLAIERAQDRELARIRVLELVDHQQLEALRPGRAHGLALEQQALSEQLQVVEVDGRARLLQPLIGEAEAFEQLAEQRAHAGRLELLLRSIASKRGDGQARQALAAAAQLEVDLLEHRADAVDAVGREHLGRLVAVLGQPRTHGLLERTSPHTSRQPLLEHGEIGVDAGRQRLGSQQPRAEAMEGADERRLGVASRLALAQLEQPCPDTLAQLARCALGEGDREDPPRRDAVLAHGAHEALDEHRGLAAARRSRDEQRLGSPRDRLLLLDRQLRALAARRRAGRLHPGECLQLRRVAGAHRSHRQIVGY